MGHTRLLILGGTQGSYGQTKGQWGISGRRGGSKELNWRCGAHCGGHKTTTKLWCWPEMTAAGEVFSLQLSLVRCGAQNKNHKNVTKMG